MDCMLGCEQVMVMQVALVVSTNSSCCTWSLPAAAAEKGEGKDKDCQTSPRETVKNSDSETETDWNGRGHVPMKRDGVQSQYGCVDQGQKVEIRRNLKSEGI